LNAILPKLFLEMKIIMMFHNGRDRNSARVCQIWV